ncbi:MAG: TSUP family transporter [Solobacterium sp.]|nr:TSUP family transporter [Solobacterium sp.]
MEWFWIILAALGAGIGTGLAGLSAATVMVPILIVLCPSFSSETGAYQATAIALASDILGSAVTAYTYAKHKNIDLKRGWIMFVCIVVMCTIGSYAAFRAGNVVLGTFTLFLTFFIGIRFLIKPDTTRNDTSTTGEPLDWKGIAISLFFGLTIGFGTGFVGTGGGMMMLVVFTVFLGMDVKSAVGTSTFIMTFTALIASISHILIHPAILLERWNVMLVSIVIATAASLFSARFANRVDNRTVGLVTGGVLTVLGGAMLLLNFRQQLLAIPYAADIFVCLRTLILLLVPCVLLLIPLRFLTSIPSFVFRKLLHLVAVGCFVVMLIYANNWQSAAITSLVIAIVIYPVLHLLEQEHWYAKFFVQKSKGEVIRSLLMVFLMFAGVIVVAWGYFNQPDIAAYAILMWGIGDAAAALIGVPFGKHKIMLSPINGKKSYEGSIAMFIGSFLAGMTLTLLIHCQLSLSSFVSLLIAGIAGTITELFSPSEWDTVTVPAVLLVILLLLKV